MSEFGNNETSLRKNSTNSNIAECASSNEDYTNSSNVSNTCNLSVADQILIARQKLEKLRENKKSLEFDNYNLDCKIIDLRQIISRISEENDS